MASAEVGKDTNETLWPGFIFWSATVDVSWMQSMMRRGITMGLSGAPGFVLSSAAWLPRAPWGAYQRVSVTRTRGYRQKLKLRQRAQLERMENSRACSDDTWRRRRELDQALIGT